MPTMLIFGVLGVIAVGLLAVGIFSAMRPQASPVQERLGRYADIGVIDEDDSAPRPKERRSPLGERLNKAIQRRGLFGGVQTWLGQANLKINIGEYISLTVITLLGGAFIGVLITALPDCTGAGNPVGCLIEREYGDAMVVGLIGAGLGAFAPRFYVNRLIARRRKQFDLQLGDTLNLMVNSLRAGYSVLQAMEAVAKELPAPVSEEFRRVVQEVQLGIGMPEALDHMLSRINSEDLDLVVTAMNVQREVGGNLAEILDVMSYTIRERIRIKNEINVLVAQGMLTGSVISLMPFALVGVLFLISRDYIMNFFIAENQPLGWIMMGFALFLILIGWLFIRNIVNIEV